ncbi:MAG: septum formation inhibitor Maf [Flavobacteriia bacterium]|nr:septum formation inhibitor Maf [Flavobacteriia bacterium]
MDMPPVILASASPRRRDLLQQLGIEPAAVISADIDETPQRGELPGPYAVRMAREKAMAVEWPDDLPSNAVILAGDTVVACGRRILPKAETEDEARACLALLSGRRHRVLGGVALRFAQGIVGRFGFLEVLARGFNLLHGILHDGTLWVRIGKEAHVVFQLGELLAGLLHGLARIHGLLVFLAVGFLRSARFALLVAHRVKERVARRPELVPGLVRILAGYKTRFLPFGLQAL